MGPLNQGLPPLSAFARRSRTKGDLPLALYWPGESCALGSTPASPRASDVRANVRKAVAH